MASINSWEVSSSSLDNWIGISIDNKRSLFEGEASSSHLSHSWSHSLGFASTGKVIIKTDIAKSLEHSLGSISLKRVNNEWKFWNIVDLVSSGLNEWTASGSSKSRCNSVSLLVEVDLSVPLSPDSERGKQSTLTAHVTEGSLTRSVGTRS